MKLVDFDKSSDHHKLHSVSSRSSNASLDSVQVQRLKTEYGLDSRDLVPGSAERFTSSALIGSALAAGVHWGRAAGQVHSDILPFLLGQREKASIFDLQWTLRLLGRALAFLREAVWGVSFGLPNTKAKGRVLFISQEGLDADNPHCFPSKLLRAAAKRCGEPAMGVREANLFLLQEKGSLHPSWRAGGVGFRSGKNLVSGRGGNHRRSSTSITEGKSSKSWGNVFRKGGNVSRKGGDIHDRTGWKSGSVLQSEKLPVVAIVLIGGHSEGFGDLLTAAKRRGCPVVSIVDSASSLENITYPIPGNSRSVHSLYFFLDLISYGLCRKESTLSVTKHIRSLKGEAGPKEVTS
jgi:ribosomal protein S2